MSRQPVSYTHLDVYKRPSSNNPKKLGTVKVTRTIDELTHAYALVERDWTNAVSYTHLSRLL